MAEIIQLRRDRSNSWATINPILAQGEIGYELDTNRFKIGDGLHSWRDLDYFASSSLQVDPMPTANASNLNKIVEYVGNTTQNYTNGYFYKCKREADKEVTWEMEVQSDLQVTSVDINTFINYIATNVTDDDKEQAWDLMLGDITVTYNDSFGEWVVLSDDSEISFSIADLSELGIEITGTPAADDYFVLHFQDSENYIYTWKQTNVQPETVVVDALTSTSDVQALSANQGRVLKDLIDNVQSIGRFLAMWDADTGIARYLDLGFEYEQGDYFIIATVDSTTNYMPNGATYTGASVTPATDPIEVSDMYFYTGSQWVYLPNHQRQIAVDEQLDSESRNPVENRVVTNALDEKIDKPEETEVMLYIDENGDTQPLYIGNGLEVDDTDGYTLNNTKEGQWGSIEGDITEQTDLIELINNNASVGVPQLSNVTVKQVNKFAQQQVREPYEEFKGDYSDIIFNVNLSKEQIIERMDDLYVGISRFKKNRTVSVEDEDTGDELDIRYISKFSLMNDRYVKLDHKMYCWRIRTNEDYGELNPMSWSYFYTSDNYSDDINLLYQDDPDIRAFYGEWTESNYAACFNALRNTDLVVSDVWDPDYIERYPEGDIDRFINVGTSLIENDGNNFATLRKCRKYVIEGDKYYLWCENWEDSSKAVYYALDHGIPDFYGDLIVYDNVAAVEETGTFIERRDDLNYWALNTAYCQTGDFADMLSENTLKGGSYGSTHIHWNCYWLDYPVMPVLLRDCEVLTQNSVYGTSGEWVKLKDLVRNGELDSLTDYQPVQFRFPYDTYYLWLRFSAWQKRCLYADDGDGHETGEYEEVWDEDAQDYIKVPIIEHIPVSYKNSISASWEWSNGDALIGRRAFGRQRSSYDYNSDHTKICEYVLFNLYSHKNISMGTVSDSTPIQKRLYINRHNGGSGIRN